MYQSIPLSCTWGKDNEMTAEDTYKYVVQHEKGHPHLQVTTSGLLSIQHTIFLELVQMV